MDDRLGQPLPERLVLLFGSLALSFDHVAFTRIRETILDIQDHHWMLEVIRELPQDWETTTAAIPSLRAGSGLLYLENLRSAFLTAQPLEILFPLPNIILIPLTVISHLTQYMNFLKRTHLDPGDCDDLYVKSKRGKETVGLCTGLLSAFAVSSASGKEDFTTYGAVAIRLGMLLGMVVDAQDAASELGTSKSLSTVWNTLEHREEMLRILEHFPEVRKIHLDIWNSAPPD